MFCGRTDSPRLPNSGPVPAILETFVQVSCPHPKRLFHSKQRRTTALIASAVVSKIYALTKCHSGLTLTLYRAHPGCPSTRRQVASPMPRLCGTTCRRVEGQPGCAL